MERLTGHEILGLRQRVSEELGQPFTPLAIVLSQITVNTLDRLRQGAITLGPEILVRLQGGTQLTAQTLLVIEPYQDVTTVLRTVQDALVILGGFVPIRQRCEHGHEQRTEACCGPRDDQTPTSPPAPRSRWFRGTRIAAVSSAADCEIFRHCLHR